MIDTRVFDGLVCANSHGHGVPLWAQGSGCGYGNFKILDTGLYVFKGTKSILSGGLCRTNRPKKSSPVLVTFLAYYRINMLWMIVTDYKYTTYINLTEYNRYNTANTNDRV